MAPYREAFREKPRAFTADDDNMWRSLRTTGPSLRSFAKLSTKRTSSAEHCSSTKEGIDWMSRNINILESFVVVLIQYMIITTSPPRSVLAHIFIFFTQTLILFLLLLQLIVVVKSLVSHII